EVAAIMTGAPVPEGADTIVPLEVFHNPTQDMPDEITFTEVPKPDQHIRHRAEDVHAGSIVAVAGTVLAPQHIGAIAAAGTSTVYTARGPQVAILSTGEAPRPPRTQPHCGPMPAVTAALG